ncbi:uncharacterized protein LOC115540514 [Gadus morhua]|uniref:Uncharacterized LOC115540514 n=1 Tax=Gadus morhua TaxID=8049 RepID=A0A8C5ASM1_GADMO|nr:uncharacterized protein LOC115540514 [Gadus morhua]
MDLIPKPNCKSTVWQYFGLIPDDDGKPLDPCNPICRLCRRIVHSKNGSTTNLRAHLRTRHRKMLVAQPRDFPVLDSGSENPLKDAPCPSPSPLTAPNQNYVSDASVPPAEPGLEVGPSRAALSLPFCLNLWLEPEPSGAASPGASSKEWVVEMGVHAKLHLQEGLIFGPFVGELVRGAPRTTLSHAWIIREESEFYYVDASDENKSNWMRYVSYAAKEEDHNLIVTQINQQIYYKTSKPIPEGGELKVRIGEDYAAVLCLDPADTRCDFGKKESILRLYLDVQLVTLEEPSSSLCFTHGQVQDAMPIIHKVTSTSTPDSALGVAYGPAYLHEEYNFFPGTENLMNHPTQGHSRLWYFYGFRPDPSGQPLDWSTAVCKLCGHQVALGDTVSHLRDKHQISSHRFIRGQRIRNPLYAQKSTSLTPARSGSPDWSSTPPFLLGTPATDTLISAVCNFLIRDLYQPAMVEGQGFKELMHTLVPSNKDLPTARALEALLKDLHAREEKRLRQLLLCTTAGQDEDENTFDYTSPSETQETSFRHPTDAPRPVTLSVDVWRHVWLGDASRNATLWVHYVDANFDPQNWALTTQRLTETETEGVVAQVKTMALEWGIPHSHLVLLGGDAVENGALSPRRPKQSGEPDGRDPAPTPTIPCFFNAVRGCVEEVMSLPIISDTLRMFQDVLSGMFTHATSNPFHPRIELLLLKIAPGERAHLKSWANSPLGWQSLFTAVNILNKHSKLLSELIKLENGTIIKNEHPVEADSGASGVAVLGESEWKVLQELCSVLKPMDVACRTLAREAFPCLSLIKPMLIGLLTRHLVSQPGEVSPLTKGVKMRMRERLEACYKDPAVNRILCVACSLDPQFRHLGFMEAKDKTATHDWLKEEAVKMMKEDQRGRSASGGRIKRSPSLSSSDSYDHQPRRSKRIKNAPPVRFTGCDDAEDEDSEGEDGAEKDSTEAESQGGLSGMQFLLGDLLGGPPGAAGTAAQAEEEAAADMELSLFTADKRPSAGVEPLQWWKAKAGQFPLLAAVARMYLAAPAVAGSGAVGFATDGGVANKRRNIPPESLAEMLFLHHNHVTTPAD